MSPTATWSAECETEGSKKRPKPQKQLKLQNKDELDIKNKIK